MCSSTTQLAEKLIERCDEIARCSEEGGRLTRRFLTAPMLQVHELLSGWMQAANMKTRIDNAGNIVGRRLANGATQTLILGSHLDTVPNAGKYDGVLGVLIALAVIEALGEVQLPFHLDVIGFSEEEGTRYSLPYLGSSAVAGCFDANWLGRADQDGITVREAIQAFQLDPDQVATAAYNSDEVIGFVEPHLEQGPVLEQAGLPLGVVSAIAGQSRLRLEFVGKAGHAGTTPMAGRRDALAMAAEFVLSAQSVGHQTAGLRATVGRLQVLPNAPNVIPGRVQLSLEVRHAEDDAREQAVTTLLKSGATIAKRSHGEFVVAEQFTDRAVAVDANLSRLLTDAVVHCGHVPKQLVSGAGHDAVVMAQRFPVAMLFLRHPGGVSHHPDERVESSDVAAAIEVMVEFVRQVAQQFVPSPAKSM